MCLFGVMLEGRSHAHYAEGGALSSRKVDIGRNLGITSKMKDGGNAFLGLSSTGLGHWVSLLSVVRGGDEKGDPHRSERRGKSSTPLHSARYQARSRSDSSRSPNELIRSAYNKENDGNGEDEEYEDGHQDGHEDAEGEEDANRHVKEGFDTVAYEGDPGEIGESENDTEENYDSEEWGGDEEFEDENRKGCEEEPNERSLGTEVKGDGCDGDEGPIANEDDGALANRTHDRDHEAQDASLQVSIMTWNLAEVSPPTEDVQFLRRVSLESDLVAIGVQEIENLKPRRHEGRRTREWRRLLHR